MSPNNSTNADRPMSGIRVVEVAMWMFAPAAAAILADLGAEVVKVEHPQGGDPQRATKNRLHVKDAPSVFMEIANRGKRSVGLDLTKPDGRAILDRLIRDADVFITNFLPAARRKLRLEPEDVQSVNPRIVYARASGMGTDGPEAESGGYDLAAGWGRAGTAFKLTPPGGEPPMMPASFYDLSGSVALAGGIAMGLLQRERTGRAPVVDSSLLNVGMWPLGPDVLMAPFGDFKVTSGDRRAPLNPTSNWYRTSDGRWIYLVHLQSDRYWPELCQRIGRPDLVEDPRFSSHLLREEHSKECVAILDEVFASRTLEEWKEALKGSEGVWAPIQSPRELYADPQVLSNGFLMPAVDSEGRNFHMVSAPVQFDGRPNGPAGPCPEAGQHTEEVLLELGMEWDEIAAGKQSGAIQ